jgi:hypothetical protein
VKVETWIFTGFAIFFAPVGVVYGILTDWKEPLGVPGLFLTSGMCALIAAYLFITSRRIDPRPEDNPEAQVADGAGDLGQHFPPYSWAPLWGGAAAAFTFMGMAVGWWMLLIGLVLSLLAAFLWVFEYYRGENAH